MNERTESSSTESSSKSDCFCGGTGPRFTREAKEFRSNLTVEHFRASGAEFLKGIRSILDVGIEFLSKDPNARGTTVNVE